MAGFMFVVCVPTSECERNLNEVSHRRSVSNSDTDIHGSNHCNSLNNKRNGSIAGHYNHYYQHEPESIKPDQSSLSSVDSRSNANSNNATITNTSDTKDIKNDNCRMNGKFRKHEDELSRVVMKKGMTDGTKVPHHEGELPMEKVLAKLLKILKIDNAVHCEAESKDYRQVFFTVGSGDQCEEILRHFSEFGIGMKLNSVVSVIPCTLHYQGKEQQSLQEDLPCSAEADNERKFTTKASAWDKFVLSVRARLTVAQVVEGVKATAELTFDFVVLLIISGFVAALGLVEDSTVFLVASMLISPLMGPIMAGTFGTVIGDKQLQKIGVRNELIGLLVCIFVGFVFGLAAGLANEHWGNAGWPTEEMLSRGLTRSLWVGTLIALASGAAVAIAILGNNTGSLVGVAISASLMPPAVNAGLLWALACMDLLWTGRMQLENEDGDPNDEPTYTPIYSDRPCIELAVLGALSLGLTLINIICIFLSGILVLKIKEVAPQAANDQEEFWKYDIRFARDYNRTLTGQEADDLKARLAGKLAATELHKFSPHYPLSNHKSYLRADKIFNSTLPGYHIQRTWSPSTTRSSFRKRSSLKELNEFHTSNEKSDVERQSTHPGNRRRHSGGLFSYDGAQPNNASWIRLSSLDSTRRTSSSTVGGITTISESLPQSDNDANTTSFKSYYDVTNEVSDVGKTRFTVSSPSDSFLHV